MKKILIPITAVSILLTSSCSFFSPEYTSPEFKKPKVWNSQNTKIDDTENWDLTKIAWWREFHDPQLNNFITTALKQNNQLQITIGNIKQAQAEIDKANYGWLPTASVGGGGFIAQNFGTGVNSSNPALKPVLSQSQTIGGGAAGIIPSYTINIIRQVKLGEIARLGAKMEVNVKNATRLSIISQVSYAYFSLITAKKQLILQQALVDNLQKLYNLSELQHKLGSTSPFSVELVKQQLEAQRGKIATIKNDIIHFQNTLKILMGRNPGKIITTRTLDDIDPNKHIPVNLPSKVLESRPDVGIAEFKLQSANANIGLARSQFFPSIDLTGAFGNATLALGELATMNAWAWAAEAVSVVPVFNLSIFADTEKAKAQFYQGYYDYISTIQSAFQDVDDNLAARTADLKYLDQQKISLASTTRQEKILNAKYELGAISKAELTSIYLNSINQEMQVNQAKLKSIVSIINVYQSLGGGYNVDNYNKPIESNPAWDK